jgi:hypothetical protein
MTSVIPDTSVDIPLFTQDFRRALGNTNSDTMDTDKTNKGKKKDITEI